MRFFGSPFEAQGNLRMAEGDHGRGLGAKDMGDDSLRRWIPAYYCGNDRMGCGYDRRAAGMTGAGNGAGHGQRGTG